MLCTYCTVATIFFLKIKKKKHLPFLPLSMKIVHVFIGFSLKNQDYPPKLQIRDWNKERVGWKGMTGMMKMTGKNGMTSMNGMTKNDWDNWND